MEEIFKGLVERAQYYEQFESFRYITYPKINNSKIKHSKQFGDTPETNLQMKVSLICI